jgi:hypothetical protein
MSRKQLLIGILLVAIGCGATITPTLINLATQVKGLLSAANIHLGGGLANSGGALTTVGQQPAQLTASFVGTPANAQVVIFIPITVSTVIASGCTNMLAGAKTAATGTAAFTVKDLSGGPTGSSTTYCTATWSASGNTAAITGAGGTFAAGDYMEIDGPSTADSTLATIGVNVYGVR